MLIAEGLNMALVSRLLWQKGVQGFSQKPRVDRPTGALFLSFSALKSHWLIFKPTQHPSS